MPKHKGKLIAFNWKENPTTSREAVKLFRDLLKATDRAPKGDRIAVFPPFLYLPELSHVNRSRKVDVALGAQDVFWENIGAYTGEIGPRMIRGLGNSVAWTLVGHSERRKFLGETDEMVNRKIRAARESGLKVILCVGESKDVRAKGSVASQRFVEKQLAAAVRGVDRRLLQRGDFAVAYEPIWAIGTGTHCPPEEAVGMARLIKKKIPGVPVLYGGSVDGMTVADYLCYDEINGVLVGGASLKTGEVKKIIQQNY